VPKIVDHEAARADMLERAFELFATTGYDAVSMRQLAKWLSVSTGTLYHYFETKEHFFSEMVRYVAQRDLVTAVASIPAAADIGQRADALLRFLRTNETHLRNLLLLSLDFVRHSQETEVPVIREAIAGFTRAIAEHIGGDVPREAAQPILASVIGALAIRALDPGSKILDELASALPGSEPVVA
jgi:AcrR family transcriptional regulator